MANNWGGARPGAGRPKGSVGAVEPRKQRQLRAHDDEWELIKRFDKLIKKGHKEECIKFLEETETNKNIYRKNN